MRVEDMGAATAEVTVVVMAAVTEGAMVAVMGAATVEATAADMAVVTATRAPAPRRCCPMRWR